MKLLSRTEAVSKIKKDNQELFETAMRLKKDIAERQSKLNLLKADYSGDKNKILREFEEFCKEIQAKKSKLLKDFQDVSDELERKKDIYYGLVEKQDELKEMAHELTEREMKINLREAFIKKLEEAHGTR